VAVLVEQSNTRPADVLRKVVEGLSDCGHPKAHFIAEVAEDMLRKMNNPFIPPEELREVWDPHQRVAKDVLKTDNMRRLYEDMPMDPHQRMADAAFAMPIPRRFCYGRSARNIADAIAAGRAKAIQEAVDRESVERFSKTTTPEEVPLAALMDRSWSQETEEFIKRQKQLAPAREQERVEALHKAQEDARKLEKRTELYKPVYCKKCGTDRGCMCPRPKVQRLRHTCTGGYHVRIRPIPPTKLDEMGLHEAHGEDLFYCLDCNEVVDSMGRGIGKISTLADAT
jgi:hypothetical protein